MIASGASSSMTTSCTLCFMVVIIMVEFGTNK